MGEKAKVVRVEEELPRQRNQEEEMLVKMQRMNTRLDSESSMRSRRRKKEAIELDRLIRGLKSEAAAQSSLKPTSTGTVVPYQMVGVFPPENTHNTGLLLAFVFAGFLMLVLVIVALVKVLSKTKDDEKKQKLHRSSANT